jgi:hypothetical protein
VSLFRFFSRNTFVDIVIASLYALVHSLVLYLQIVALNVAINSTNSALLSLLVSSNFVELKAAVFKKYGHAEVMQVASGDIVERFHLTVYVFVILIANLSNIAWGASAVIWLHKASQLMCMLLSMEMVLPIVLTI